MRFRGHILLASSIVAFLATRTALASSQLGVPPPGFSSGQVRVNGTSLHYVRGGTGPALILLHGFPETWSEYRAIMPELSRKFTVAAVDLPGVGRSGPSSGGYATATIADDIHALVTSLNLQRPYIVGHDHGGLVTYAYLRRFQASLRGAMILDVPVPGVTDVEPPRGMWHVSFIQAPKELAERLVDGRQAPFLGWFFDLGKFTNEERAYYIKSYGAAQLHASFEFYRSLSQDAEWNAAQTSANAVPLVIGVGERSFLGAALPKLLGGYRKMGMSHVISVLIPNAGHYVVNDNPPAVSALIERYAVEAQ